MKTDVTNRSDPSVDTDKSFEVEQAKQDVDADLSRFESAMDSLADKVADTSYTIRQVLEAVAIASGVVGTFFLGSYLVKKITHSGT